MDEEMDKHIMSWILEFLLLQEQLPDATINEIIANLQVPIDDHSPRLKKTALLRFIASEIRNGSVSETVLDSIESIEELDRKSETKVLDSMKEAYCAVALECTVKYIWGNQGEFCNVKFSRAVERIWGARVRRLVSKECELVTDELMKCGKDIELVLSDISVYERLKRRNTRNDALLLTAAFVSEARAIMGLPFIQSIARIQREAEEKQAKTLLEKKAMEASTDKELEEMQVLETLQERDPQREAIEATTGRDLKENEGIETMDERELKQKETVKLRADGEDKEIEVDHNLQGSGPVTVGELDATAGGQGISGLANQTTILIDADTSPAKKTEEKEKDMVRNMYVFAQRKKLREPAKITDKEDMNLETTSSQHNALPAPVKMTLETHSRIELQATVADPALHVADVKIDESPEAGNKNIRLRSPKTQNMSPLSEYKAPRFAKRRKVRKWSLEEEDALRQAVLKYGMGRWKLILTSEPHLFNGRTEVDLKDKWRNLTK